MKALIIQGPQGSGKSTIARALAEIHGSVATTTGADMLGAFGLGSVLRDAPDTVIVEEWDGTNVSQVGQAKMLASSPELMVNIKNETPRQVATPTFIFVTGSSDPIKLPAAARRFVVLDTTNFCLGRAPAPMHPQDFTDRLRSAASAMSEAASRYLYGPEDKASYMRMHKQLNHLDRAIAGGLSTEPKAVEFDAALAELRAVKAATPNSDLEGLAGDYRQAAEAAHLLHIENLELKTQLEAARNELRAERQEWDSDDKPETRIHRYEAHNPILEVVIEGYRYGFTIRNVEKDSHEWLMGVVSRQMQEVHDRAVRSTRQEIQLGMKKLLGIKS